MYYKPRRYALAALTLVLTSIALNPGRAAQGTFTSPPNNQIDRFLDRVAKAGYLMQEGAVGTVDLDYSYCAGALWTATYPNPGSSYLFSSLPQSPVQTAPNWTPNNFRLREDEAIVVIGTTPPPSTYLSLNTTMFKGTLRKDVGPPLLWVPVIDTVNNRTIRTTGATPFGQPFVIVSTGNRRTLGEVHGMLRYAGLEAVINDEPIAPALFQLGLNQDAEQFAFAMRISLPIRKTETDAYVAAFHDNIPVPNRPIRIFRVRPAVAGVDQIQPVYGPDPVPVPQIRVAGTGKSELDMYPTLKLLRQRIIDPYSAIYNYMDLETNPTSFQQPYSGLQRAKGYTSFPYQDGVDDGGTDAIYLPSENFTLPDGAFIVAYGAEHRATGKATYSGVTVYADPVVAVSLASVNSPDLQGSASDYINDQPDADMFYAWTFTRGLASGSHVTELMTTGTSNKYCQTRFGLSQPVDLNIVRIIFRAYLEPATNTRPLDTEMIIDRILLFTPK